MVKAKRPGGPLALEMPHGYMGQKVGSVISESTDTSVGISEDVHLEHLYQLTRHLVGSRFALGAYLPSTCPRNKGRRRMGQLSLALSPKPQDPRTQHRVLASGLGTLARPVAWGDTAGTLVFRGNLWCPRWRAL